ncbi:MAG: radical SAM protein [Lachnospiraceae bacterium]|nr:radical SAM protein [Lachnospiraceae bacterium]
MKYDVVKIKITNDCNRECVFCVFNGKDSKREIMSYEEFVTICKRLKKLEFDKLHINGGEPLMHPDYKKMIMYIKEEFPKKDIVLGTNAIILANNLGLLEFVKESSNEVCIGCDTEHNNIDAVEKVVPQILDGSGVLVVINSLIEYMSDDYERRLKAVAEQNKGRVILVKNHVYHMRQGNPINKLTGLCKQDNKRFLMVQENGLCYRCFNCEVPQDSEFSIYDEDFYTKVNLARDKHYRFCGWCPLYQGGEA